MLENVKGFLDPIFSDHRRFVLTTLENLGYTVSIKLLNSSDYGVPQLRLRVIIIGVTRDLNSSFSYPKPCLNAPPTVGETFLILWLLIVGRVQRYELKKQIK
ncbi:DNA cytosine methyltransferase [Bullifex porci]|uniref:DNA cytosine methyltransferase n=1 Tax=Bullifex porci TaxID=2606638 RepID=UPI00389A4C29